MCECMFLFNDGDIFNEHISMVNEWYCNDNKVEMSNKVRYFVLNILSFLYTDIQVVTS